jgi:hypothetical protein
MNTLEDTARYWLEKGVATLPIRYKSKTPEVRSWAEYTERLPKESEIEGWYATPYHNIAVITGWRNLCILDFDDFARYEEWFDWAYRESIVAYTVSQTSRMIMSSRGVHLYFYTREKGQNMKLDKLDVLCDRKYALTAPSIHPSGVSYTVLQDLTPARIDRVEQLIPPEWLESYEEKLMRQMAEQTAGTSSYRATSEGSLVDAIKARYRIEDFFPDARPSGSGWCKVRCPLHDDRNPSAGINVDQQIFTCFTHCYGPKPLDVIGLYARIHGISNTEAISKMSEEIGVRY